MAKHRMNGVTWWCLPGGGIEPGETPEQAALRELWEECRVKGKIITRISHVKYELMNESFTYLVDIGDEEAIAGDDPEFSLDNQVLIDIEWLALDQIPERDRAYLWSAGLLGVPEFLTEVESWGNSVSYPKKS